jgi:TPR repeat protein
MTMRKASTKPRREHRAGAIFCLLLVFTISFGGPQLTLAETYEEGRKAYLDRNYKEAFDILEPLAKDGNSEAQKMLGIMYDYGHGVSSNSEKALYWYLLSAEQGHPAVQYQVGAKYFRGDGVKQNYKEAARWWEMAANGGQVDAQFNLGLMYFRGLSIEADDTKAASLFSQAAEQGHGHSQYSLAVMYAFGRGVEKDYATALQWFEKSAAQDIGQAQFNLGVFYENGYGVDKDIELARRWYEKAAAQGTTEAEKKLLALDVAEEIDEEESALVEDAEVAAESAVTESSEQVVDGSNEDESNETDRNLLDDYDVNDIAIDGIRREAWVLAQAPEKYTLQINSGVREDAIVNFLKENNIGNQAAYVQVIIKEVTRYNALYGVYDNYSAANEAIEDLPQGLLKAKPWVRSFRMIQDLLNQDEAD